MEKSWKITLSDGTQLKDLKLSGNNYISGSLLSCSLYLFTPSHILQNLASNPNFFYNCSPSIAYVCTFPIF